MNLMILELAVIVLGLGILLGDLWTAAHQKHLLGYAAAALVGIIFLASFGIEQAGSTAIYGFNNMLVLDNLAVFFKRFFLLATVLVLLMSVEFADRIQTGISEFYCLILFALTGMMFASSANDFIMVFVSLELISVTFYVLNSFQRNRLASLEAGIKYLILSALSAAFLVFGIALIFGTTTFTNFSDIQNALQTNPSLASNGLFLIGVLMVLVGLGFKIAAFPFQIWAPDVYQGSPTPATAFLAIGSKAAGIILLLRVLFIAVPAVTVHWSKLLIVISAITILYGNLCAIPQRSLKRLLGYSSISNAGYLLLGFAALSHAGTSAILYFLSGYLFTVIAAFTVICLVTRNEESDDITVLAGLNKRSPLLAAALTIAMISLAGIPPVAGFFGKFLLLKAVVEQGAINPGYYYLVGVAIFGVVVSLYYYFGVIRAIYWSDNIVNRASIPVSWPMKLSLFVCIAGILYLGVFPNEALKTSQNSAAALNAGPAVHKQAAR